MIAAADSFEGQYASEAALVGALLGRIKIAARERGWRGTFLIDADWLTGLERRDPASPDAAPAFTGCPPTCLIVLGPGHGDVTVTEVSALIREKRAAAKAAAARLTSIQQEGRLL